MTLPVNRPTPTARLHKRITPAIVVDADGATKGLLALGLLRCSTRSVHEREEHRCIGLTGGCSHEIAEASQTDPAG